ncbi:branched-chain amino acid ABC transporter permease [Phreatobacter sp. AB_2022a]|uniref:branched-chain amino acid ABC transporter permease n=1 Tax=Phreatobacter sp. AB_2022a TaxID=3003134 RepID=UPI0022870627|nr:branched-chain amino acid ABC transporter permease [Phreatobacter sp. AB_2022a]MCZ0735450.1 branched-chain amino acid ABC transporter permease [Phreatobacter sp. AB_2022a]
MTTTLLIQSLLSGVTNGFVYGLIGLGISVIYRGTRVVNAMQGDFALVAGIAAYLAMERLGAPTLLAFAGGMVAGAAVGWAVELLLVRPTKHRGGTEDSFLLVTLGGAFAVSAATLLFFGRDSHPVAGIGGSASLDVFDAAIRVHAVWLIVSSILVVIALRLFYTKTFIGKSIMAASIDAEGAATIGINVPLMRTLTFVLGGAVGGIAGVLVSPLITLHYEMGLLLTLKGFTAAIIGTLGNPFGAIVGGLALGIVEALAIVFVSSGYKDVIAMAFLILIMVAVPNGILGRRGRAGG